MVRVRALVSAVVVVTVPLCGDEASGSSQQPAPQQQRKLTKQEKQELARLDALKQEAAAEVDSQREFTQQMVDSIFSFGELGFQEIRNEPVPDRHPQEERLHRPGGHSGHPDGVHGDVGVGKAGASRWAPTSTAFHRPHRSRASRITTRSFAGAPGHGEGHNSGQAVNITAAIAVKKIMERQKIPGTIRIWPGTAEELVGTKAYFIRAGLFKDVDVALFTHVGRNLGVSWGAGGGTGLVSVAYSFMGETAHSGGCALARPKRARRRRADEHRVELSTRAPAAPAPIALRDQGRRRSAQRRPANGVCLVLLPRRSLIPASRSSGASATRSPRARR